MVVSPPHKIKGAFRIPGEPQTKEQVAMVTSWLKLWAISLVWKIVMGELSKDSSRPKNNHLKEFPKILLQIQNNVFHLSMEIQVNFLLILHFLRRENKLEKLFKQQPSKLL